MKLQEVLENAPDDVVIMDSFVITDAKLTLAKGAHIEL